MPFSDIQGKDVIKEWIRYYLPLHNCSFLDIGPGSGTYADLIREVYLDYGGDNLGRVIPARIDAIEAWAPYIEQFSLKEKYDEVIVADVRYVDPICMSCYNAVIVGDVIEHLTKPEARVLLDWLVRGNDYVIVSFPVLHLKQEAYEGNFFEVHKDHWTYQEMIDFANENQLPVVASGHGDVLAWFLFSRAEGETPWDPDSETFYI